MGQILLFECGDCNYNKTFFTGPGMMEFRVGLGGVVEEKELYNCPRCGFLSLRTVKYEFNKEKGSSIKKKQKCRKCNTLMALAEESIELTCPNCHSNKCICLSVGQWD